MQDAMTSLTEVGTKKQRFQCYFVIIRLPTSHLRLGNWIDYVNILKPFKHARIQIYFSDDHTVYLIFL